MNTLPYLTLRLSHPVNANPIYTYRIFGERKWVPLPTYLPTFTACKVSISRHSVLSLKKGVASNVLVLSISGVQVRKVRCVVVPIGEVGMWVGR